jgi:Predicted dehydrogenases and related proteins
MHDRLIRSPADRDGTGEDAAWRVGVVGSGAIAHVHVPALLALGVPVKVSAFSRHGVQSLVERYGVRSSATFDDLLSGCDIIDICTPTATHLGLIEAALRAGKHVICEKPIVRHATDGARILALAGAVGRLVLPAHVVRYFSQYVDAHDTVQAGRLGTVREAWFSREGAFPTASWFADDEQSGGIALDLMIHDLDAARWIIGEVAEVRGTVMRDAHGAHAEAELRHCDGAVSHVTARWGAPGTEFRTSIRVDGDEGRFERAAGGDPVASAGRGASGPSTSSGTGPSTSSGADADPYSLQLRAFLDAFEGDPAPRVSLADGIRAVELAEAVLASGASGRPVSV